jgi:Zn-dependent protease/CBS domain-containing protein
MKSSWRLFRIAGIDIGVHYTWLFIFILISWSLAVGLFPQQHPGWSTSTYWAMGIFTALALFISVLLHELAHSLVAQARGMKVGSITLFIFGGVSNLEEEPQKPRIEFQMAVVGPLTSLVLGFVLWGLAMALAGTTVSFTSLINGDKFHTALASVVGYLGWINVTLAIFNLIPGFPLDGGRVLRSILWGSTGNLQKATNAAATVGRLFGWGFIIVGILMVFGVSLPVVGSGLFGGLWIAFIGWFLNSAAEASRREMTLREHLSGVRVKDVMNAQAGSIDPETTVEQLVANIFQRLHGRAVPVCKNDRLQGIVTIDDVKKVPREQWAVTPVESIMTRQPLYTVTPDSGLHDAFKMIAQHAINQVLVTQDGRCIGMLSRADIIAHLQLSQELGRPKKS